MIQADRLRMPKGIHQARQRRVGAIDACGVRYPGSHHHPPAPVGYHQALLLQLAHRAVDRVRIDLQPRGKGSNARQQSAFRIHPPCYRCPKPVRDLIEERNRAIWIDGEGDDHRRVSV